MTVPAAFIAADYANAVAGSTNITVNKPAGVAKGHLLAARVSANNVTATWDDHDGTWSGPFAVTGRGATFYKIAGTSEPASYQFDKTGGSGVLRADIEAWDVGGQLTPVHDIAGADDLTANTDSPSVSALEANSVLSCGLMVAGTNTNSVTKPSTMTQTYQTNATSTKAGASKTVGSGATGIQTWTSPLATVYTSSFVLNPSYQGSASGSWSASGAATGTTIRSGAASGSWSASGAATGQAVHNGAASGSWSASGAATGQAEHRGSAAGSWDASAAAAGETDTFGSASGGYQFIGIATSGGTHAGFAGGSWSASGSAAGAKQVSGLAVGSWIVAGAAAGTTTKSGLAVGNWEASAAARGAHPFTIPRHPRAAIKGNRRGAAITSESTKAKLS